MNGLCLHSDVTLSSAPLDEEERTETRRFCGYAALGEIAAGESSWRFFQSAGVLEWRLNTLAEAERRRARYFLSVLLQMERAVHDTSDGLDTQKAAIWTRNTRELSERISLYEWWRKRLCGFLGIAPGPDLSRTGMIEL